MPERTGGRIVVTDTLLEAGFVQVPMIVLRDPELSAGAKVAYGALLWYGWKTGEYPGQEAVAQDFGMGERSVRRYLSELEKQGYIAVDRPGLGQPNSYTILSPWAENPRRPNWPVKEAKLAGQGGKSGRSLNDVGSEVTKDTNNENERPSFSRIAQTASERLNDGKQQRSIRGFLEGRDGAPGFNVEIATVALERTEARHADDLLTKPVAYFYDLCKILRDAAVVDAQEEANAQERRLRVALSLAQAEVHHGGDLESARRAVAEYWPDLAEEVVAKLL